MYYSEKEREIIGTFCFYASKTREGSYRIKWKNGTNIYISLVSIEDSDNNLELDDPNYEDFISIIVRVKKIKAFTPLMD